MSHLHTQLAAMPLWIHNRPPECCGRHELRVAQWLNGRLRGEGWVVRWGYWYHDNQGTLREGDFLVLGGTEGRVHVIV